MQQPYLTSRSVVVAAPVQAWSALDGQVDGRPGPRLVEGIYCGDARVASRVLLASSTHQLEHVGTDEPGGGQAAFDHVLRTPELGVDPALLLRRERLVDGTGATERYRVRTSSLTQQAVQLTVRITPDSTTMQQVKSGQSGEPVAETDGAWQWRDAATTALLHTDARVEHDAEGLLLSWSLTVPPRGSAEVGWRLDLHDAAAAFVATTAEPLQPPRTDDEALRRLLACSFADINGLRLAHRDRPDEAFLAAGAPWYFTLFGRDSLISALNLLPHDLSVAQGTLCVLAGLQGRRSDVDSAEQPGKILHEVRQEPLELELGHQLDASQAISLPPLYYGTIDATCLWVVLLDRAEQAGLAADVVRELLPTLRRALGWIEQYGDADGDGFLEYIDTSGHGLANQGWKDSGDSVRFADGSLAQGAVALCEVQGYAHAAALAGARLLAGHGDDPQAAARWTRWAQQLAERFRARFWAEDELGRYPVLALDGEKRQVTGVASNMGHLLGTGILQPDEAELVVARLMHPSLDSGYGIRTLSTGNGGYWPVGYHVGSVWTHDTAIIIDGMLREGFDEPARRLARGLLRAAPGFGNRLPELFGGEAAGQAGTPQRYPASCRPQAWAATSSVVVARALAD